MDVSQQAYSHAGGGSTGAPPLLRMNGIVKSFPGVKALRGVSLELHAGHVMAIVGENGAGKSSLIKTLSGAYEPDEGTIEIDGVRLARGTRPRSMRAWR